MSVETFGLLRDREENALIYRFGIFELDTETRTLRRGGRPVVVQEKPLLVLQALLENPGEVVERAVLRQRLWPEGFHVDTESGINAAVARLREALRDVAANPRFVATIPRRGYRFIAPVHRLSTDDGNARKDPDNVGGGNPAVRTEEASGSSRTRRLVWPLLGALALLALVFASGLGIGRVLRGDSSTADAARRSSAGDVRLAVLPFLDLSTDPDGAFLGDGLTAELISTLGRLEPERLRVIALTSVVGYRNREVDIEAVGQRLDVAYVLEGTVRLEGDTARVTAALVEVADHTQRWSATYDRDRTSLIALEREIAIEVVGALALAFDVGVSAPREIAGRAGEHLLHGRALLEQRTEAGFRQAVRRFEAAIAEDPSAAAAYAGMAIAWTFLGLSDHAPRERAYPQARQWAERALERDPLASEAHLVMAAVEHLYAWRFDRVPPFLERALALNPSSAQAHLFAAEFWASQGDERAASEALERALALDPLSPALRAQAGWLLFVLGREEEGVESCRRALVLDPDFLDAWDNLKWIHIRRGDEAAAIEAFLEVVELETLHAEEIGGLRAIADRDGIAGLLRASLEDPTGRLRESGQSPYNLALDHAALGNLASALDWLESAFVARETDLVNLAFDPRLDGLRGEPRFHSLLDRVGLVVDGDLP